MTEADRLREHIRELEELRDKRKWQRTLLVVAVLSVIIYYFGTSTGEVGFLIGLILAPFMAIACVLASFIVLYPIMKAGSNEEYEIEHLRKALHKIEAEQEKGQE